LAFLSPKLWQYLNLPYPWLVVCLSPCKPLSSPLQGLCWGQKGGALAALIYVLLGAAGLPVFAHFQGGLHVILGPTGGYILSYPLMAFIAGFFADKNNRPLLALGLFFGFAVCLAIGMLQFALILGHDLQTAFLLAVAPFIPVEALKMAAVFITAPIIRNLYNTRR